MPEMIPFAIAHVSLPISSPFTPIVYLSPLPSYFAYSCSFPPSCPSDPDTLILSRGYRYVELQTLHLSDLTPQQAILKNLKRIRIVRCLRLMVVKWVVGREKPPSFAEEIQRPRADGSLTSVGSLFYSCRQRHFVNERIVSV